MTVEPDENGWMPIETAPRDYTEFLAYGSYTYPGDAHPTEFWEVVNYSGIPSWPWSYGNDQAGEEVFSHWQPLPKPPVERSKSQEQSS